MHRLFSLLISFVASGVVFGLCVFTLATGPAHAQCKTPIQGLSIQSDTYLSAELLAAIRAELPRNCPSAAYMRMISATVARAAFRAGIEPQAIEINQANDQFYDVTLRVTATTAPTHSAVVTLLAQLPQRILTHAEIVGEPTENEIIVFRYVLSGDAAVDTGLRLGLKWLRNGVVIDGASTSRYRLKREDVNAQISAKLTLFDPDGTAFEVREERLASLVAAAEYPPEIFDLAIDGIGETGSQLTARYRFKDDNPDDAEGETRFIWLRDNYAITGASGPNYEVTTEDVDKVIGVRIIPQSTDGVAGAARTVMMREPIKAKPVTVDPSLLDKTPAIIVDRATPKKKTKQRALPSLPKPKPKSEESGSEQVADIIIKSLGKAAEAAASDNGTGTEPDKALQPTREQGDQVPETIVPRKADIIIAEGLRLDPNETTRLTRIAFSHSDVFTDEQLMQIAADFMGKPIDVELIRQVVEAVGTAYLEAEYELSRALVPEQTITAGVLSIRLVEARVGQIVFEEINRLSPNFIRKFLAVEEGDLLSLTRLERSIRLYNATNKSNLTSELSPGAEFGETDIFLTVQEPDTIELPTLSVNNYASEVTDWRQQAFSVTLNNTMKMDDEIFVSHNDSNGSETSSASISMPIGFDGLNMSYAHSEGNTRYTSDGAGAPGIVGTRGASHSDSLSVSMPLVFNDDYSIYFSGAASSSYSEVTLANSNVNLTESRVSKLALSIPMNYGNAVSNFSFAPSVISLNAKTNSPAFSSTSEKWMQLFKADINASRYLTKYATLNLRSNIVYSEATQMLNFPGEILTVGGPGSVRAYQPSVSSGHQGYFVSAELRSDLANWDNVNLPSMMPYVQPYAFIDHAFAQSRQRKTQRDNFWSGAGVGVSIPSIANIFSFDAYWATPLDRKVHEAQKEAYEDELFQFSLSAKFRLP